MIQGHTAVTLGPTTMNVTAVVVGKSNLMTVPSVSYEVDFKVAIA